MTQSFLAVKTLCSEFLVPLSHGSRAYKLIVLPNGLTTFLISDPSDDIASAAVCVATGSHNDPPDLLGLAHLCEHMLFTGTKLFPNPNSFHHAINSCGGSANAYTTGEQTCFYFEVPSLLLKNDLNFDQVLSIFSTFFKNPLFDRKHINSEILAINEEHTENIAMLSKILFHANRILASDNHPFSRFGTGNLYTLLTQAKVKKINIRSKLTEYFNSNYTPNKMTLVLKGPQSVNHLQKLAIKHFNSLANTSNSSSPTTFDSKHNLRNSFSSGTMTRSSYSSLDCLDNANCPNILQSVYAYSEQAIPNSHLGKCMFIKSNHESRIRLLFPVPPSVPQQFVRTWIGIIGDESENTLCQFLILNHDFATELFASSQDLTHNDSCLIIDITPTKKGITNIFSILLVTFQYIHNVFLQSFNEIARYITEMEATEKIAYLYSEKNNCSLDETATLAERLQGNIGLIGKSNLVKGFCFWNEVEKDSELSVTAIDDFINTSKQVLSLSNFNLIVVNSSSGCVNSICEDVLIPELIKDPYFEIEYQMLLLNLYTLSSNLKSDTPQGLMIPNPLNLLDSFNMTQINQLLHPKKSNIFSLTQNKSEFSFPQLLDYSRKHDIWLQKELGANKIAISFKTQSFTIEPTAKNCILVEIVCFLIGESLRFRLYQGELLGYLWGIFPTLNSTSSITISVTGLPFGFEGFLRDVIRGVIDALKNISSIGYNSIKKARMSIRNQYKEILNRSGLEKLVAASYVFLEENIWHIEERIDVLDETMQKDLVKVSDMLLNELKYTSILVTGDISLGELSKISKIISELTRHETVLMNRISTPFSDPSSYYIKRGMSFSYLRKNSKDDPLNLILYYLQIGDRDNAFRRSMATLLEYLLSTKVNEELRGRRQLGYGVFSGIMILRKTVGVQISITSGNNKPEFLKQQIEEFIDDWEEEIATLSENEFRESIIEPFLESLKKQNTEEGIPCNLNYSIEPLKGSSSPLASESYLRHKSMWEKIVNRTYRFDTLGGGREAVDERLIKSLDKKSFLNFFKSKVSMKSQMRSSLTIMFESQVNNSERDRNYFRKVINAYISEKGVSLLNEEIDYLIDTCQEPSSIPKEVFRLLRKKNKGGRFLISSASDIGASYIASLLAAKNGASHNQISPYSNKIADIKIGTIDEFHNECSIADRDNSEKVYGRLNAIDVETQEISRYYEELDI